MKYVKLSFGYIFKNFLYIFLLAIVPTAYFGGLLSPFKTFEFMTNYSKITVRSFGDIFYSLIDFKILPIILVVLGIAVLSVFVSLAIGQMENHMRSGKLNYKSMFQYLNNNILVVIVNLSIILLIWFVLQFLLSGLIILLHIICSGIGNQPTVLNIVLAVILCVIKFIIFMFITSIMFLTIPNMLISGYPTKQAIANSIKLMNKNTFSYLLAMLVPFVVIIPLACLLKGNLAYITNILGVLLLFIYYTSLCMTSYFELSNINRYDNRKYYNYWYQKIRWRYV